MTLAHLSLWLRCAKKEIIFKISAHYNIACREKVMTSVFFQCSKFQKGHNSYKNRSKLTTLALYLKFINRKSYTNFQLNMSKRIGTERRKTVFLVF